MKPSRAIPEDHCELCGEVHPMPDLGPIDEVSGLAELERTEASPAAPWIGAVIVFAAFVLGLVAGGLIIYFLLGQQISNGNPLKPASAAAFTCSYPRTCAGLTGNDLLQQMIHATVAVGEFIGGPRFVAAQTDGELMKQCPPQSA